MHNRTQHSSGNTLKCKHLVQYKLIIRHILLYLPLPLLLLTLPYFTNLQLGPNAGAFCGLYVGVLALSVGLIATLAFAANKLAMASTRKPTTLLAGGLGYCARGVMGMLGPLEHWHLGNWLQSEYAKGLSVVCVLLTALHLGLALVETNPRLLLLLAGPLLLSGLYFRSLTPEVSYAADLTERKDPETQLMTLNAVFMAAIFICYMGERLVKLRTAAWMLKNCPYAGFIVNEGGRVNPVNLKATVLVAHHNYASAQQLFEAVQLVGENRPILSLLGGLHRHKEYTAEILNATHRHSKSFDLLAFGGPRSRHQDGQLSFGLWLKERSEAKEREEDLSAALLCSLAHELNTPLNGVVPLLRLRPPASGPQATIDHIILSNAEILCSKIDDLLDYARLEMHEVQSDITIFEVGNLLDELQRIFSFEAKEKNLALRFRMEPSRGLQMAADRKRVRQVLVKLIFNAIKHTNQGLIEVAAAVLHNTSDIQFSVEDTGDGMTREQLRGLFKPLTRTTILLNRRAGSLQLTGLGLTMSHKICSSLGGTLQVESGKGQGTRFWFVVPNCRILCPDRKHSLLRLNPKSFRKPEKTRKARQKRTGHPRSRSNDFSSACRPEEGFSSRSLQPLVGNSEAAGGANFRSDPDLRFHLREEQKATKDSPPPAPRISDSDSKSRSRSKSKSRLNPYSESKSGSESESESDSDSGSKVGEGLPLSSFASHLAFTSLVQELKRPNRVLNSNTNVLLQSSQDARQISSGILDVSHMAAIRKAQTTRLSINPKACPLMRGYKYGYEETRFGSQQTVTPFEETQMCHKASPQASLQTPPQSPAKELLQEPSPGYLREESKTLSKAAPVSSTRGRALIVDDVPTNIFVLGLMLNQLNISHVHATDGEEAFNKVKASFQGPPEEQFQLIFMDLNMPVLGGLEATRKIRNLEYILKRDMEIPIIAVTAFDTENERSLCYAARMQMYLTKPVDARSLQGAVAKYIKPPQSSP